MSVNYPSVPSEQSAGCDPKSSKRNSGLFSFFKWFKPSTSRESINSDVLNSHSSSCDSLSSIQSGGTTASFSFVPPNAYATNITEKCIIPGPETDTYRARLKQRDKRRENDKNLTLRKKYNLFFNRDTLLKNVIRQQEENTKSLPLMTKSVMEIEEEKGHRRTNSESSKSRKAGAYLHVKGKRKAPQPPGKSYSNPSTMSLKKKKRLAPLPPEKVARHLQQSSSEADIIFNDSLKLDHGILKPAKEQEGKDQNSSNSASTSARSSYVETPVSPRPWYKRQNTQHKEKKEKEQKLDLAERLPETQILRNSTLDLTLGLGDAAVKPDKKKDEKRKSGISYLTNISELDREASEIIKKEQQKNGVDLPEMPEFMRPREDSKINTDSWVSPKRRSARDLIAKFNAITSVTKVTVFGTKDSKRDFFGKQHSQEEKRAEQVDKFNALMKSESASAIKNKPETPKLEKKSWVCAKCNVDNEYWRIICHVCSTIKPYFDDFYSSKQSDSKLNELKTASPLEVRKHSPPNDTTAGVLERSKTQIGFSALATYNANNNGKKPTLASEKTDLEKREEKEKLKKMLIEMKNSLPKRKSNILMKQNSRTSVIMENPDEPQQTTPKVQEKTQEEKVASILIGTKETIYENIKIKKTENPKPLKVSSAAQTSPVVKKIVPPNSITNIIKQEEAKRNNFELMRPKDFEDIYGDRNSKSAARVYANMAQSDELSLFFNVPKKIADLKNDISLADANADTIEINRLLRRLETAIAKGDLVEAASFAKELAQLKVNCSVIRRKGEDDNAAKEKKIGFQIEMYVEDKISHRGPFPIQVTETQTVLQLKQQVEKEFEIPVDVQRWILGKELVTNDSASLKDHNVTSEGCPVFLYLVAPDKRKSQLIPMADDKPSTSKVEPNIVERNAGGEILDSNKQLKKSSNVEEKNQSKDKHAPKIVDVIPKSVDVVPKTVDVVPKSVDVVPKSVDVVPKSLELVPKPADNSKPDKKIESSDSITTTNNIVTSTVTQTSNPNEVNITDNPVIVKQLPVSSKPVNAQVPQENNKTFESKMLNVRLNNTPPSTSKLVLVRQEAVKTELNIASITSHPPVLQHRPPDVHIEIKVEKNIPGTPSTSSGLVAVKQPSKASLEDDFEEYESKTLRPQNKEWECHLCTLLNPVSSSVCAICAAVRMKAPPKKSPKTKKAPQPQTYQQLVSLDNADLVENVEPFECVVCFLEIPPKQGVTLRECLHQFCKTCLANTIEFSEEAEVKCPYRDNDYSCNIALQDREIKSLVTKQVYDQFLAKSIAQAENKIDKSFHCKTPDCKGWCIFEDNVNEFRCPVCRLTNCLTCQAIHMGLNCKQYQERMNAESENDEDAKRTKEMLAEMVNKGEALTCPTCKVVLMKKWGCDWLRCSMCKTEICWVTRGPRWGPGGKGDTSGGCQCGLNGVKCHPKCNYCH